MSIHFEYPRAYGGPVGSALLKKENRDFVVTELFDRALSGEGEHLYLWVKSNGDNTQWLAKQMAERLGIDAVDVGFSGLKDRSAITYQWFSIYDPKREFNDSIAEVFSQFDSSELLQISRDTQKLRRGMHAGNHFSIRLEFEETLTAQCAAQLENILTNVGDKGVPNYFGHQRFGHDGNNLKAFDDYVQLTKAKSRKRLRKPKGIVISAARSQIFNAVLALKVESGVWSERLTGDPQINGLPSSPLWGRGRLTSDGEAKKLEQTIADQFTEWAGVLECLGLQQERRANICKPAKFDWSLADRDLNLSFELPPGEYATTVLREIAECYEPERKLGRT